MDGKGEDQRRHVTCLRLQSCPMTKQRLEPARTRKRKVLGTELKGRLKNQFGEKKQTEKDTAIKVILEAVAAGFHL